MKTTASILTSIALTSVANAAIVGVTSVSFTGTGTEETVFGLDNETQLIDGSGLVDLTGGALEESDITGGLVTHDAVAAGNAWASNAPGGFPSDYFASNSGASLVLEFSLDNTYNITDFASWGYHFGAVGNNDISAVTIDYGVGNFTDGTTGSLAIAQGTSAGAAVVTNLGGPIQANQLRITITDNYYDAGDPNTGGDRVGLTEVRFLGTVVPEPSSTALLGLGGIALLLRRRK